MLTQRPENIPVILGIFIRYVGIFIVKRQYSRNIGGIWEHWDIHESLRIFMKYWDIHGILGYS